MTRPAQQAQGLCELIVRRGGVAVCFPTIEIVGLAPEKWSSDTELSATNGYSELSNYQWIIFTSANAVNFALIGNSGKIRQFVNANIAAIGKSTAAALKKAGLFVNLVPESGYNSEALLAAPEMQLVEGKKILIVRGQGGRDLLATELAKRGADVEYREVYKRMMPTIDNTEVIDFLGNKKLTAVTATSGEALENLLKMIGTQYQSALKNLQLIVISDRIKSLAEAMGFSKITVTADPSDSAIVNALTAAINGDKRG